LKITTTLEKVDSSLGWNYFILIDVALVVSFIKNENRRIVCDAGQGVVFQCALMPDGKGNYQIIINKERRVKLGWVLGQIVEIVIAKDTSEYGLPISDELSEVLAQEQEGSVHFQLLTPGKRRTLIHWVDNVKNPEIRIRRAIVLLRHLKNQEGSIDFRRLNQEMKEENQRAKIV